MTKTITDLATPILVWQIAGALAVIFFHPVSQATTQENRVDRGEYLLHAGGCISCHTADGDDAVPLAGGRAIETPFGTFYAPNITPDDETGIGGWSDEDFLNALWLGVGPDGTSYFPAFPYPSYTGAREDDLLAIKAYLSSIEPVHQPNQENQLRWYLSSRLAARAWQAINFEPGRFQEDPERNAEWNRGAYLVQTLGHCGECHTPRTISGKSIREKALSGNPDGPDRKKVPGITQEREDGIGRWSVSDIEFFLELGMLPDGDFTGGAMSEVIDDNTSHLTDADRHAIAVYLKSLTHFQDERPQ
jgi:mono/diheme cytochrome c family protein